MEHNASSIEPRAWLGLWSPVQGPEPLASLEDVPGRNFGGAQGWVSLVDAKPYSNVVTQPTVMLKFVSPSPAPQKQREFSLALLLRSACPPRQHQFSSVFIPADHARPPGWQQPDTSLQHHLNNRPSYPRKIRDMTMTVRVFANTLDMLTSLF